MKTKSTLIFMLFFWLLLVTSCIDVRDKDTKEPNSTKIETAENFVTTAQYVVPTAEGYITTVSYKGMVLARTSTPLSINVPKEAVSRGTDDLTISYTPGVATTSYSNLWQTILFEDSKDGDLDYNDIIIHANYQTNGQRMKIGVHPIALGSTKDIKIGIRWIQGGANGEVVIAENARNELFAGESHFINTTEIYNTHYDDFIKTIEVDLPSATDVVGVEWFIVVDNNVRINAVNQSGEKCLDDNFMPYGFALTNVGANGEIENHSNRALRSKEDVLAWEAFKPDVSKWAFMPVQPEVPTGALDMAGYEPWKSKNNTSYVLKAGSSFSGQLKFEPKTVFYILGNLELRDFYGNGAKIVVLPGGVLNVNTSSSIQGVEIDNYGTISLSSNLTVSNNAILKSNKNIDAPTKDVIVENGTIFIAGDIISKNVKIINNGKLYANSLNADQQVYSTNSGALYVNGSVSTANFEYNSSTTCYIDCALHASEIVTLTNSAQLNVKGYINTPKVYLTSGPEININSGGMIEAARVESTNCNNSGINVIGSGMGAIVCDIINFQNTGDIRKFLTGNLGVASNEFHLYGTPVEPDDSRIIKNTTVTFNKKDISIPKSDCVPGFNQETEDDNGFAWFEYPKENVNINTCYDFDSWKKGNFNFTKKPGAKVFDIKNTNPSKGAKLSIFQIGK